MTSPSPSSPPPFAAMQGDRESRRFSVPIGLVLVFGFGGLVTIAIAAVLFIALNVARDSTQQLVAQTAELSLKSIDDSLNRHLLPAQEQVDFLTQIFAIGRVALDDEDQIQDILLGALAATPQIAAVTYVDKDFRGAGASRYKESFNVAMGDWHDRASIRLAMRASENTRALSWDGIAYLPELKGTHVGVRKPVYRNGQFEGFVAAVVSIQELSYYLLETQPIGGKTFIIRGDQVLAHPYILTHNYALSESRPLPSLADIGDPVLTAFHAALQKDEQDSRTQRYGWATSAKIVTLGSEEYICFYRPNSRFDSKPWITGVYFRLSNVNQPLRRVLIAAYAGGGVLLLAVLSAFMLAQGLRKPILRLAQAADTVSSLRLGDARPLPSSRFRELDMASRAFNAMLQGLHWLEAYVPRSLVHRLIGQENGAGLRSEACQVTLMFTDIVGFSALGETMSEAELAALLNEHFALLTACIEKEGGTVDKFIGDAVMAYWGAPDPLEDHAARALRAAAAIAQAITADNRTRRDRGLPVIRVRIGLHSGSIVAGNIGTPGRLNYTVIGNAVNVAQRIEQFGKLVATGDDVIVLVSAATAALGAAHGFDFEPLGPRRLRGHKEPMELFRLRQPKGSMA